MYPVTDESPATQVMWAEAVAFCNWLCLHEKLPPSYVEDSRNGWTLLPGATGYRLPSEAQWEFACRAGGTTQYSFGDDPEKLADYGWHNRNSQNRARAVGLKPANPFGLHDMHGNVWEWCNDWMDNTWYAKSPTIDPQGPPTGALHAARGGSFYDTISFCRAAFRRNLAGPAFRGNSAGFRVVRDG
jgi:formylglycine-generating enzyme required for sulfatase activity